MQELLFSEKKHALLVIFQGMDTSGKDSTIKNVCTGINPQGLRVYGFNVPTSIEFEFSFLQRFWVKLPPRGLVHVFNRSYYEEVSVVRVQPSLLEHRKINQKIASEAFWHKRFEDINGFEKHLAENGTRILKIFLHISKEEQLNRLVARLENPKKHWKFHPSDIEARGRWDDYEDAYSKAIRATSTKEAPWYIIPADHKPVARVLVADAIANALTVLDPKIPELTEIQKKALEQYRSLASLVPAANDASPE